MEKALTIIKLVHVSNKASVCNIAVNTLMAIYLKMTNYPLAGMSALINAYISDMLD